jgi:hypothetical protein
MQEKSDYEAEVHTHEHWVSCYQSVPMLVV